MQNNNMIPKEKLQKKIKKESSQFRLAMDIGTNSIGWALYKLDQNKKPVRIEKTGVRIFSTGREDKTHTTLNATRRQKRLQRRQRDRYLQRRQYLLQLLREYGLFPKDAFASKALQKLNPYELRARGLDEKLDIHHFGRVLFHLNQRRGFKSNRKSGDEKENGLISQSIEASREAMVQLGARTYGEFLWKRIQKMEKGRKKPGSQSQNWVLARRAIGEEDINNEEENSKEETKTAKDKYAVYAQRAMIEEEFNKLWDSQMRFHKQLKNTELNPKGFNCSSSEEALTSEKSNKSPENSNLINIKSKFHKAIFYQRKLKAPIVGNCYLTREKRISRASPFFQKFRILKELNNLSYVNQNNRTVHFIIPIGVETPKGKRKEKDEKTISDVYKKEKGLKFRDEVIEKLFSKKPKVTFSKLETEFKNFFPDVDDFSHFNLSAFSRDFLEGNHTNVELQKVIPDWCKWTLDVQDRFVELLEGENTEGDFMKDDEEVVEELKQFSENENLNLSDEMLSKCLKKVNRLPSGHGSYSKKVIQKILPFLEKGQTEWDAIRSAGFEDPSDRKYSGELSNKLPKYQEVLRAQCVEMSLKPDPKNRNQTFRIPNPTVHIAFNQLRLLVNDIIRWYGRPAQVVVETARDLPMGKKTKSELDKSIKKNKDNNEKAGKIIEEFGEINNSSNRLRYQLWQEQKETCLYSGKKIPKSKLFSAELEVDHILPWSKTLDDHFSNKALVYKSSNQDKADHTPYEYFSTHTNRWKEILQRVRELPQNKKWRFEADAMDKFAKEGDFLDRQLNDTRYISKHARAYLERICSDIWTVRGQTTSLIRHLLQFDKKTGEDHRRHAKDALVIGLIDRSFIQHISKIAKNEEGRNKERLKSIKEKIKKEVIPWSSFKKDAKASIHNIIVSHRKRTKRAGQLHNETAYGFSKNCKMNEKEQSIEENFSKPIDVVHYVMISSCAGWNKKKIEKIISDKIKNDFLTEWENSSKISKKYLQDYHRKTGIRRVRIKENQRVIPIKNKAGNIYKTFKGDGNYAAECFIERGKRGNRWNIRIISRFDANQKNFRSISQGEKLIINDMLFFDNKFWRVVKLTDGSITFSEHFESNVDKRNRDKNNDYKYTTKSPQALQKLQPKRVNISPCGMVTMKSFNIVDPSDQSLKKTKLEKIN